MHCHTRHWVNWSLPSYVSSYIAFFGIDDTLFKRIFSQEHISTDLSERALVFHASVDLVDL